MMVKIEILLFVLFVKMKVCLFSIMVFSVEVLWNFVLSLLMMWFVGFSVLLQVMCSVVSDEFWVEVMIRQVMFIIVMVVIWLGVFSFSL